MTRSRRRTPIYGCTSCDSEKQDKAVWHGRMRAAGEIAAREGKTPAERIAVKKRLLRKWAGK